MTAGIHVTVFSRPQSGSKTYLVESGKMGILIDPGFLSVDDIISTLNRQGVRLDWIFLTHEHFDHCEGADAVRMATGAKLACSPRCNAAILDPKKNLSAYITQGRPFALRPADVTLDGEKTVIEWAGRNIEIISTPGHSQGSVTIKVGNLLFTGDTLLTEDRVPTNLPGGNKQELANSHMRLRQLASADDIVYPGHGEPQKFDSCVHHCMSNRA